MSNEDNVDIDDIIWSRIRKGMLGMHLETFPIDGMSSPEGASNLNWHGSFNGCKFMLNGMDSSFTRRQFNETPLHEFRFRRFRQNPSIKGLLED
jgi:hypothetical protein